MTARVSITDFYYDCHGCSRKYTGTSIEDEGKTYCTECAVTEGEKDPTNDPKTLDFLRECHSFYVGDILSDAASFVIQPPSKPLTH